MNLYIWIIFFLVISFVGELVNILLFKKIPNKKSISEKTYVKKELMTTIEREFYNKLKNIEPTYKIIPQINLNTIIEKISTDKFRNELFRNVDFGIFNDDLSKILLLVELNDSSHMQTNRKQRDVKVKKICEQANISLITFYTNMPNEKEYIINRILNEINRNTESNKIEVQNNSDKKLT